MSNEEQNIKIELTPRELMVCFCAVGSAPPHDTNEHLEIVMSADTPTASEWNKAMVNEISMEEQSELYEQLRQAFEREILE